MFSLGRCPIAQSPIISTDTMPKLPLWLGPRAISLSGIGLKIPCTWEISRSPGGGFPNLLSALPNRQCTPPQLLKCRSTSRTWHLRVKKAAEKFDIRALVGQNCGQLSQSGQIPQLSVWYFIFCQICHICSKFDILQRNIHLFTKCCWLTNAQMYTKMPRYQIQNEKIEYKVENSQKFSASSSATFLCKKTLCKYFLQVLPSIAPSLPELTQHFPEMVPQCLNFKSEEMWIFCSQIDNFQVFFAAYGHWPTFGSNCQIFL